MHQSAVGTRFIAKDANQERLRRIKLALDDYRGGDDCLPLGD